MDKLKDIVETDFTKTLNIESSRVFKQNQHQRCLKYQIRTSPIPHPLWYSIQRSYAIHVESVAIYLLCDHVFKKVLDFPSKWRPIIKNTGTLY